MARPTWKSIAVRAANGGLFPCFEKWKPCPDTILLDGKPLKHRDSGTFYLDWRENGKRIQLPCGKGTREALDAWRSKTLAETRPDALADEGQEPDGHASIADAVRIFLLGVKGTKAVATFKSYERDLRWFRAHCLKSFVGQVSRQDILALFAAGREEGGSQKTINRRVIIALMALRNAGSDIQLKKGDWPKTIEQEVETYEPEELAQFFTACSPVEGLLFRCFLASGFRSREIATLTWPDIGYRAGTFKVEEKPDLGFYPKNYEQRTVTVPHILMDALRDAQK